MNRRITALAIIFIVAFIATIGRLFYLQVLEHTELAGAAQGQQGVEKNVQSTRGTIFIRSHYGDDNEYMPVALTRRGWDVWVAPSGLNENEKDVLMTRLPELAGLEQERVSEILSKTNDPYEPLLLGASDDKAAEFTQLGISALGKTQTLARYYPSGQFASHVVGFVGKTDEKIGQYGIEEYFDDQLSGEKGFVKGFRNNLGALISALSHVDKAEDGADVYLTLDYNIQRTLEKHLQDAYEKYSSRSAQGIVVEPKTGRVLALASFPSFDPNNYQQADDLSVFINPVVQNVYEPGSVFKPLTMAIALDIHVISPELTYRDTGSVQVADATIKNSGGRVEGVQSMTQVLEKSLNTGAVFAARKVPRGVWRDYIERFGIGEKTGIELAGEVSGNIENVKHGGPVEIATSAFGQGISMTPLELVMAIGALANDGILMKPYIVEKIVSEEDKVIFEARPSERAQVVSSASADAVTKMLVSVVEKGSGWGARMDSHWVAGKTGTAQVAAYGKYSDEVNHTFVGYAPAFEPEFVMLLKLENPQGVQFSEASVGPLFKEIASFILNYYGTEPSKPQ